MRLKTKLVLTFTSTILLLAFCNCGQQGELGLQGGNSVALGDGDYNDPNDPNSGGPGVNEVINNMKPALAVRATGCIMCHSNIKSNIITDFGYGNNYFFGGYPGTLPNGFTNTQGKSIYGDYDFSQGGNVNWGGSTIASGTQVIVPKAPTIGLDISSPSLAAYLTTILSDNENATGVTVKEVSEVFIGAPTRNRIVEISGVSKNEMKYIPSVSGKALLGLASKAGLGGSFYTNDPSSPLVCDGDIIIDGVLYLNQPKIQTTNGCRIYVTGSVFVSAPLSFLDLQATSNLQITSARMVALGVGHSCSNEDYSNSIDTRLTYDGDNEGRHKGFFTRNLGSPDAMLKSQKSDADLVKTLPDATCTKGGRGASFERLLVNAPVVHNRYNGQFKGLMISEIALLALNALKYEFDPVFSNPKVRILPLLKSSDFLEIKD